MVGRFHKLDNLIALHCRHLKKELASAEKEAEIQESHIYHFKVEIESLKSIQEEKEETLRSMTRAVVEEERKLERAQVEILCIESHSSQIVVNI